MSDPVRLCLHGWSRRHGSLHCVRPHYDVGGVLLKYYGEMLDDGTIPGVGSTFDVDDVVLVDRFPCERLWHEARQSRNRAIARSRAKHATPEGTDA